MIFLLQEGEHIDEPIAPSQELSPSNDHDEEIIEAETVIPSHDEVVNRSEIEKTVIWSGDHVKIIRGDLWLFYND